MSGSERALRSVQHGSSELNQAYQTIDAVVTEISRKVVMPEDDLLVAVGAPLMNEHVLLEGVPGTAKTTLAKTMATAIGGTYGRVQGGPDVMPSGITGNHVYNPTTGERTFVKGPIFSNITLVDEANRLTTKSQSALLEGMEEKQVTVGGETFELEQPSVTLATQNPAAISDGVYNMVEAVTDRFIASIDLPKHGVDYMLAVDSRLKEGHEPEAVIDSTAELALVQDVLRKVEIAAELKRKAAQIVVATRSHEAIDPETTILGGQRAFASILKIASLAAVAHDTPPRQRVDEEDIEFAAAYALPHRMGLKFEYLSDPKVPIAKQKQRVIEEVISSSRTS